MNMHSMTTRSKSNSGIIIDFPNNNDLTTEYETLDKNGNLADFIIDDSDSPTQETKLALSELKKLLSQPTIKPKKFKKKNSKTQDLNDIFLSYIILKATEKANIKLKSKQKLKSIDSEEELSSDIELSEDSEEEDISLSEEELESDEESEEEESEEEYEFEYDEFDEEYEQLIEKYNSNNTEDDITYFHNLNKEDKQTLILETRKIQELTTNNIPLRFKIINSDMNIKIKSIALENIDKLQEMDVSSGEHSKLDYWINGLLKIPFGIYKQLSIQSSDPIQVKQSYIKKSYQTLNNAIYGHNEAKTHILQILGKWIKNPNSGGNVLAIQGPMGNGKTTLVKEGISKVLDRPFAFIALGGASDSSYFDGHCFTYEGSRWGRIVQILQESQCMNPVFYFDELDKISDTQKGEEIVHMLTHLTDSSQNSLFQDNYFPGINLDLSKSLFIFSYNDESKVNKILKDRMHVIKTNGFKPEEKLKITNEYLLPELYNIYDFQNKDITFQEENILYIIKNYTENEQGVRNLKRCIDSIISKINIYMLTHNPNDPESTKHLSFQIKDFKMPITLTNPIIDSLLIKNKSDAPPYGMYC